MNPCLRVILQRKHKFIGSSLTFCHARVCLMFLSNPEILINSMNGRFVQSTFWRYKNLQYLKPATKTLWKSTGYMRIISPFMNYENLRYRVITDLCLFFLGYEIFHSYLLHNGLVNQMIKILTFLPFILDFRWVIWHSLRDMSS